ncbi:MAG TPA: hypothetical protein VFB54_04795 [Burkholderiales bacterium]|nr:hypothetical protein [Burkholderiales bacterium]
MFAKLVAIPLLLAAVVFFPSLMQSAAHPASVLLLAACAIAILITTPAHSDKRWRQAESRDTQTRAMNRGI